MLLSRFTAVSSVLFFIKSIPIKSWASFRRLRRRGFQEGGQIGQRQRSGKVSSVNLERTVQNQACKVGRGFGHLPAETEKPDFDHQEIDKTQLDYFERIRLFRSCKCTMVVMSLQLSLTLSSSRVLTSARLYSAKIKCRHIRKGSCCLLDVQKHALVADVPRSMLNLHCYVPSHICNSKCSLSEVSGCVF